MTTVNTEAALNTAGIGTAIVAEANMQATFTALGCLRDYVTQTDTTLSAGIEDLYQQINLLKNRPGVTAEEIAAAINSYFSAHPSILDLPCMVDKDGNQYSFAAYVNVVNSLPITKGYDVVRSSDPSNPIPASIIYHTSAGDLVMNRDSVVESTDAENKVTSVATFVGTYRGFAMPMALTQRMRFDITEPVLGCGRFLSLTGEDYPVINFATEITPCPNPTTPTTPTEPEVQPVEPETPDTNTNPPDPITPPEPEVPVEPEVPPTEPTNP